MSFVSYPREVQAHIDETRLISLLTGAGEGKTRVMIDVGAHFGGSAAHFVDKGWTIHCFEPDPANRAKLVARLGRRANVTIDPRAVGERPETGKAFFTSGQSTGISGLSAFHDTHTQSGEVDVTTVAEIVEKAGLAGVDFLKIDVEGFDFAVLKGVPWAHFKPAVIECEFEDAKTVPLGHSWRDIAEFLTALGYKVYVSEWHPVIRYGIRHDWLGLKRYPCDLDRAEAWGNLLAFLEDPGEEAIAAALKACVSVKAPAPRETGKKEAKAREPAKEVAKMPEPAKSAPPPAMTPRPASPPPSLFARLRRRAGLAYMAFAASVKARSLTLYRVGQFAVWSLRLARRKIRASLFGAAMLAGLIALPLVFSPLAPFAVWFWAAAALLGLAGGGLLAVAFANMMVRRFAEHELHARQMLKADLHRQLAKRDRETEKARADLADAQARLGHLEKGAGESGARFGLLEKSADETGNALAAARAGFDKALAEVRREMQAMAQDALAGNAAAQEEIAVLTRENRARLDRLEERLSRDLDALRAQSGTLADNFAEATEGVRESFIAEISRAHYRLAEDLKGLHTSQEDLAKLIEQTRLRGVSLEQRLAADFDGVREEAEAMSRRFGEMVAGIREELGRDLSTAREEIGGEVTGMRAAHDELGGRVEAAQARIGQIERLAPVFNFSGFQSFNRKLTGEHIKVIEEQWASRLGTNMTPRKLSYLAHRIATLESNLHGRLATSVENAVLRTLIAASAKGDTLHVLEIGTLFGVGLAMIHDHARPRFQSVHLTAIDPLEGYYDKGPEDLTGQIVDEATFRRNLADAGVPESDYTLIRALSTDEAAVEAASRSRYDVLIIDGDHSYAGVKADFLLYLPFVKRGGYIIFDDYDVQDWPDVKRFVDEFVQSHPDVAHVGSNWRTAVFRVVRPAAQREDVPRGEGKVALLRQPG